MRGKYLPHQLPAGLQLASLGRALTLPGSPKCNIFSRVSVDFCKGRRLGVLTCGKRNVDSDIRGGMMPANTPCKKPCLVLCPYGMSHQSYILRCVPPPLLNSLPRMRSPCSA